jgi:glutathione reductase (NADPH)
MARKFDVVVIGTGTAASTVASRCREAKWEVAVVDSRPFGGTCALRGCDPKKVLVGAADAVDWTRRMRGKGIQGEARIHWPELMRFKRTFTQPVPKYKEETFTKAGIAAYHGRARFAGKTAVQVGDETLECRYVVIAAGARPATLNIPGEQHVTTSEQFLELDQLPRSIVFIGGGYISFEFAHLSARAGARVTILHRGERPLEGFDGDLASRVGDHSRQLGMDLHLRTVVKAVAGEPGRLRVLAATPEGEREFEAEMVVHGAGRVPEIDDMELDKAGVEREPRGVKVNEYLQSVSNPAVYAAGDVAASGGPPLTPVAGYEGQIVASNLLEGNHVTANYAGIASVVFTIPPLATVGLTEQAAQKLGLRFRKTFGDSARWYSSRRVAEEWSGFKVLIEEGTDKVLGAHLLGPHAEEVINLFGLAIRHGITAAQLKSTIFAYPTNASDLQYML